VIICNIIVIPNKKPRFQKEFIWRGQGYDCKWDFISNTKYNFISNLLSRNRNYIVLICRKFQDDRKVVRFLISPKKKKVKIEVNKIMVPAFLLGTAFKECIFNRK